MRKLTFFVCLLSILSYESSAQFDLKLLEKTWLPVLHQDVEGDTLIYDPMGFLLTFLNKNQGQVEYSGTDVLMPFTYFLNHNSLQLKHKDSEMDTAKIEYLNHSGLKLTFNSSYVISFIPLPEYNSGQPLEVVKKILAKEAWTLHFVSPYENNLKIQFQDALEEDSSFILHEFHNKVNTVYFYPRLQNDDENWWSIGEHPKTQILRIEGIYSSFPPEGSLILKNFQKDKIELVSWFAGEQYEYTLSKEKKLSGTQVRKFLSNLTGQKWRFYREFIPPPIDTTGLIDLGMISDYFQELGDPPYLHDSTLVLSQRDLDQKSLVLEFDNEGKYFIYRESRMLDEGNWELFFNSTIIRLKSARTRLGDGLLGGFIEVENLTRNKLKIRRIFGSRLNKFEKKVYSNIEIYRPIK